MTRHNPYAGILAVAMQKAGELEAKQTPKLTLIAGNERTCCMSTPKDQAIKTLAAALGKRVDFAEMGADIGAEINFMVLGADALQGIGAVTSRGDSDGLAQAVRG